MEGQARGHSQGGLENHGIRNVSAVYWNLPAPLLYEEVIRRREGRPRNTWADPAADDRQAHTLAGMFADNFRAYADRVDAEVRIAAPTAGA
jgi:ATP-dependent phosphoenolpyruvate carboxykinase